MEYPGYLLNPGDMFSVDPERVLFATGARKFRKTSPDTRQGADRANDSDLIRRKEEDDIDDEAEIDTTAAADSTTKATADEATDAAAALAAATAPGADNPKKALQALIAQAKVLLSSNKNVLSAKRKQELRAFSQSTKKALSQIRGTRNDAHVPLDETIEGLEETLKSISLKVPGASSTPDPATAEAEAEAEAAAATPTPEAVASTATSSSPSTTSTTPTTPSSNPQAPTNTGKEDIYLARKDAELLHAALARAQANPIDVRKPYATPWQPREFMSAFAFIPRYLEVNQNICSAVYLRHPVARPGLAEVPTPFSGETMGLAFNWYLRRR